MDCSCDKTIAEIEELSLSGRTFIAKVIVPQGYSPVDYYLSEISVDKEVTTINSTDFHKIRFSQAYSNSGDVIIRDIYYAGYINNEDVWRFSEFVYPHDFNGARIEHSWSDYNQDWSDWTVNFGSVMSALSNNLPVYLYEYKYSELTDPNGETDENYILLRQADYNNDNNGSTMTLIGERWTGDVLTKYTVSIDDANQCVVTSLSYAMEQTGSEEYATTSDIDDIFTPTPPAPTTYSVSSEVSAGIGASAIPQSVNAGSELFVSWEVYSGYSFSNVYVEMGGVDVTNQYATTSSIDIPSVTGDVVIRIEAQATGSVYSVSSRVSSGISASSIPPSINAGDTLYITWSVDSGYSFLMSYVEMGGVDVTSQYATGSSIVIPNVTGNIYLEITAESDSPSNTHSISYDTMNFNVVFNGYNYPPSEIADGSSLSGYLEYDPAYTLQSFQIEMGGNDITENVFDWGTEEFTISNITGDLEFSGYAEEEMTETWPIHYIWNGVTTKDDMPSEVNEGDSLDISVTPFAYGNTFQAVGIYRASNNITNQSGVWTDNGDGSYHIHIEDIYDDITIIVAAGNGTESYQLTNSIAGNGHWVSGYAPSSPVGIGMTPTYKFHVDDVATDWVSIVEVWMGNTEISDIAWIGEDNDGSNNCTITLPPVASDVTINIEIETDEPYEPVYDEISFNLTNCTTTSNNPEEVEEGDPFTCQLEPTGRYQDVICDSIVMGGVDITNEAWEYGTSTINIYSVTDDVVITAHGTDEMEDEPITYSVSFNLTNVQTDADDPSTVDEFDSFTCHLYAGLGDTPIVDSIIMGSTDITSEAWNENTGDVYIESVDGDVVITAHYGDNTHGINFYLTDCSTTYSPGSIADGAPFTCQLYADGLDEHPVVDIISMGGSDITDSVWDDTTYTITINSVTDDVTIEAHAEEDEEEEEEVPIESIRYTDGQGSTCIGFNMNEGDTCDLWDNLEVLPLDYTDGVEFSSSDDAAIEVDGSGIVTAVGGMGESATITIRSMGDPSIYTTVSISISEDEPDEPDEEEPEEVFDFAFTNNCQDCWLDDEPNGFNSGDSWSTNVIPDEGYNLDSNPTVVITMDGDDITSTAWTAPGASGNGRIEIPSVTGYVEVTVIATANE